MIETFLLIFIVAIGIGIITGYLLRFMPSKDNKEYDLEGMIKDKEDKEG